MVKWTKEQQQAIEKRGTNLLISAAAGSGKTAVLVERIIQKLTDDEAPFNIDEMLVATFTNAAAEEMKNRIGVGLEAAIEREPTSYHLKKQLSLLQRASISTLHSFCMNVVRQYAYLIDLDPAFRIGDEMEIDLLKQEVIGEIFEEAYSNDEVEVESFFHVVNMFSNDRSDVEIEHLVLQLYTFAMQHPWPEKWLSNVVKTYDIPEQMDEADIHWLTILKEEIKEQLTAYRVNIERGIEIANSPDGPHHYEEALVHDLQLIDEALLHVDDWERLRDVFEHGTLKALSRKRVECEEYKKDQIKDIRQAFRTTWREFTNVWFSRPLRSHLDDMRTLHPAIEQLVALVLQFKARFTAVKREKALVDFTDLEHFCLVILLDEHATADNIVPSDVALDYQRQFKEIFVDEYQDINLVQETILQLISAQTDTGHMFMVGDVKQSIYRFRHAEPTLFIDKYEQFAKDETTGTRIDLAKNFRSRPAVLQSTNYIFKQILDEKVGEINYDEDAELIYGNKSYDDHPLENPEAELYIIDRDQGADEERVANEEHVEDLETVQMEARLYAQKIKTWIGSETGEPMQVIDAETNQKRDIQYRDIVILQRSLTGLSTMMSELKKQGIPVHAELRTGYFAAIEIQVMINVLKIIDNPYQDIPLASVLRSPIVGLNEEQLTNIRLARKNEPYYVALKQFAKSDGHESDIVRTFLKQLQSFRTIAKEGALSDLIWQIYRDTGYYDFVAGIPGGRQRQANLRALYDRARRYETTSFRGLFRFLRFIERMQEQNKDLGEARALSDQEDVVRIMTIHKSKGLEFPVVIVGGMNKEFNFTDLRKKYLLDKDEGFATKFIDIDKRITYPTLYYIALQQVALRKLLAEEMRVLYVAMTRAKEKLVMIGNVRDLERELTKWQDVLDHPSVVLPDDIRKNAKTYLQLVAPALVRHEQSTVLQGERMLSGQIEGDIVHDASRWHIELIAGSELTNVYEHVQKKREQLQHTVQQWEQTEAVDDTLFQVVDETLSYTYPYAETTKAAAKQSVTEIKRRKELADAFSSDDVIRRFRPPMVERPQFMQQTKALSAAEVGTAMHTVMQHIPLTKRWKTADIEQFVVTLVEREIVTEQEKDAIAYDLIEQLFQSEIGDLLLANSEVVEREVPFTYALQAHDVYEDWESETDEKVLIQGVIDCLIVTDNKAIIIDYKTDRITNESMETLRDRYDVQVSLYKRAIKDILAVEHVTAYLYFFHNNMLIEV